MSLIKINFFKHLLINKLLLVSTLNDDCQLEPVTDTNMGVHSSLCRLVQANKKLAYFGVFDENMCRSTGTVCGINGETYGSECAALSGKLMT